MKMDLYEHREFVARVARRLIDDEHEVEDVVQEAYIASLPGGPKSRAWLARVARNLSIDRLRRRGARQRREKAVARPERTPSTAELAERVAWQQRVVAAVLALDDNHKEVVLLRFYEELPPRKIAERLDIPVNTVNTRLRRAMRRLRGKLEREAGGARPLHLALVPLALPPKTATAAVGMKALLVLLVLAVFFVARSALVSDRSTDSTSRRAASSGTAAVGDAPGGGRDIPDDVAGLVTGHVVGDLPAECVAMGGVRMTVRSPDRIVHTEVVSTGTLRLRYPREVEALTLEMTGPRILPKTFPLPRRETDLGTVRVVRALSFGGRVFDMRGEPLVGAVVHWNRAQASSRPTDETGRYRLELPALYSFYVQGAYLGGVSLYVEHEGNWGGPFRAAPSGFALEYDFRAALEPGPVLRFEGAPEARLALYPYHTLARTAALDDPLDDRRTDRSGRVAPRWPPWEGSLFAILHAPGGDMLQMTLDRQDVCAGDPYTVDLDETAAVRLPVHDAGGRPLRGAKVRLTGLWSPDGIREFDDGRWQLEDGVYAVRLFGTVPKDGVLSWRFLAEKPGRGVFLPDSWTCEFEGEVVFQRVETKSPKDAAVSGGALPPIVVAAEHGRHFHVAGVHNCERIRFLQGEKVVLETDFVNGYVVKKSDGSTMTRFTPDRMAQDFDRVELTLKMYRGDNTVTVNREEWDASVRGKPIRVAPVELVAGHVDVFDADGKPAPNVMVSINTDWAVVPRATTDANGRAVLEVPGHLGTRLAVALDPVTGQGGSAPGWSPQRPVTIRMKKPVVVRFRLRLPDGKPFRGIVALMSANSIAGNLSVRGNAKGWFVTPPVVAELFTIKASDWKSRTRISHPLHLVRSDAAELTLTASASRGR